MPLKFNDAIEVLLQKLPRASDNIKPEYIEYADQISKKIYQALEDINSIFKGTITGLNHACLINHTCPEFWCYNIDINMPFNVEPEDNGIITIGSMAFLECKLKTSTNYPAVQNGYISTERLSTLLDLDLKRAVEKIKKFKGSKGEIFKLFYSSNLNENPLLCQIEAIEEDKPLESAPIFFKFVPQFKFSNQSKMYVMLHSENGFGLVEEDGDKFLMKNMVDLQNLLFNLKVGKDCYLYNSHFSDTFILLLTKGDMATTLLQALRELILSSKDTGLLKYIYGNLLQLKKSDSVEMKELMELFGQT